MKLQYPLSWTPVLQALSTIAVAVGFLFDLPAALIPALVFAGLIALQDGGGAHIEYRPVALLYALGGVCFLLAWPIAAWSIALAGTALALITHFGHRPYHWLRTEVLANTGFRSSTHRRRT